MPSKKNTSKLVEARLLQDYRTRAVREYTLDHTRALRAKIAQLQETGGRRRCSARTATGRTRVYKTVDDFLLETLVDAGYAYAPTAPDFDVLEHARRPVLASKPRRLLTDERRARILANLGVAMGLGGGACGMMLEVSEEVPGGDEGAVLLTASVPLAGEAAVASAIQRLLHTDDVDIWGDLTLVGDVDVSALTGVVVIAAKVVDGGIPLDLRPDASNPNLDIAYFLYEQLCGGRATDS